MPGSLPPEPVSNRQVRTLAYSLLELDLVDLDALVLAAELGVHLKLVRFSYLFALHGHRQADRRRGERQDSIVRMCSMFGMIGKRWVVCVRHRQASMKEPWAPC